LLSLEPEPKVIRDYKHEICQFWDENFPSEFSYTGEDYFQEEPWLSILVNKFPFMVLFFLWRKRRFAKPVLGVLAVVTVFVWYKMIRWCCCRNKNKTAINSKKTPVVKTTDPKKTN
jgi:hypothetical protein